MEIVRTAIYICIAIFFGPFIFADPIDRMMLVAFWTFVLALIIFIARKTLKWINFLVIEKENYTPWEKMDLSNPLLLTRITAFLAFLKKNTDTVPSNQTQKDAN